jgi:hypothetical protein
MPTIDRNDDIKEQSTAQRTEATVNDGERSIRFVGSDSDEEHQVLLSFIKEGDNLLRRSAN